MAKRISLREFQESLVRRLADAESAPRRDLLGMIAGGDQWLVDLADAGEILPVPPLATVPLTQAWFRGLANVRGTLFGVVDLSAFCGGALTSLAGSARLVLVGARHGANCALLVSSTVGLRSPEDFEPDNGAAPPNRWVPRQVRDLHGRRWKHIDVPRLLADTDFLEASAV
ncbi:chemotaxis protein CheW [Denitromonas iodatirespirans]|uniref:Chemotaxis protein CheW n=1 Tax=Denitromonas iodatirespirans TaxID=2795389 RepID=A0A944DBM6_DENI1|nr:chemotaxis protein CheW [Denitromonas iodatirespirans]MBT0959733.1 chemotaxis protein CheW [Denitromonas iodatirespirans]